MQVDEAVKVLRSPHNLGKRRRYRDFLIRVLQKSGPVCVVLCAIGLGQARIATMTRDDRVSLADVIDIKKGSACLETLEHLVPYSLKGENYPNIFSVLELIN